MINPKDINPEQFNILPGKIANTDVFLVFPKLQGVDWSHDNLKFRSSVWTSDGKPVSLSFPKFFNYGEASKLIQPPTSLQNTSAIEKIDGSTLIVSRFKNQLITRVRNTINLDNLQGSNLDIPILLKRYPLAFSNPYINSEQATLLFEWRSPRYTVIIKHKHPEPTIHLIGMIHHKDYSLATQTQLDLIAQEINTPRPQVYRFNTLKELLESTTALQEHEGICLYYCDDQNITKVKSLWYLTRHRFKESASPGNTLTLFLEQNRPIENEFRDYIVKTLDYECLTYVEPFLPSLFAANTKAQTVLNAIQQEIPTLKQMTRKDAAQKILTQFPPPLSGFAFTALDGKMPTSKELEKLITLFL